jgi:hypothetical protein
MACAALGPIHATFSILAAQNGRTPVQVQRRFDWLWARMAAAAAWDWLHLTSEWVLRWRWRFAPNTLQLEGK